MKNNKHPFLKWAGIVFLVLGLVYAGLVVAGNMAVRREKAALEAAGFPTRMEQVIPAAIPEEDNAAPLYNAAFKALKEQPRLEFEGDDVGGISRNGLLGQLGQAAVAFLKAPDDVEAANNFETLVRDPRVAEFLAGIERASALPGYRQEIDYTKGPEIRLPYLDDNYMTASHILAALALQQMRQGNTAAAWRTIEISFRFADTLRDEPLIISQLVRLSQQSIAIKAMKDAAAMSAPSDEVSQRIQKQLSLYGGEKSMALALNGERIGMGEWAFSRPLPDVLKHVSIINSVSSPSNEDQKTSYFIRAFLSRWSAALFGPLVMPWDHALYLKTMHAMLAEPFSNESATAVQSFKELPAYGVLTRLIVHSLSGPRGRSLEGDAASIVGLLGLKAVGHKQKHGIFPPDLQALGAQDLVDPFTGKPLVYRPEPDGFLLYSVGPDLTDDGGLGYDSKERKGDIVWRYQEGSGVSDATSG
jgi:hypothetical protein